MIIQLIFSLHLPKRIARVFNAVCEVSLIINSSSSLSWLASSSFCLWRSHPSVCRGDRALGQLGLWGPHNCLGTSGNPQLLAARLHRPGTAAGPSKPPSLPAPSPPWYLSLCSSCTASRAQSCPLSFFIPHVSPTSPAPFFVLPNLPIPNTLLGPGCHQLHHLSPSHLHALTLPHSHQTGMKTLLKHHQLGWEKACSTLVPRPSWALAGGHKRRDVWVRRRHLCDLHPTTPAVFHTINCCQSSAKLGVLPVNTTVKNSRNPPQPPPWGQPCDAGRDLLCILLC